MINEELRSLKLRSFITEFRAESAAFWLICFYIFIEYIRPQSMYTWLDFLPWGQLAIFSALISMVVTKNKALGFGAMDKMFVMMTLIIIISIIFSWSPASSFKHWSTYTSWVLMYLCIVSILTSPNKIFLFVIFFLLINLKLSEHGARTFTLRGFAFTKWGLLGPPGWFNNSGEFSMHMSVIFSLSLSILLAVKHHFTSSIRWWILLVIFPGAAALCVIGASSRGGQIALASIVLILFFRGKYFFRKAVLLSFAVWLSLSFLPEEQVDRFNTMGEDETSQLRIEHWENAMETIAKYPLGIGYQAWVYFYPATFNVDRPQEIHNTVLQAFTELGYQGGILFLIMILTAFVMNARTKREMDAIDDADTEIVSAIARGVNLGLLGTFIASLFMSVLYYPSFWLAFALTSALRHISLKKLKEAKTSPPPQNSIANAMSDLDKETRPKHYGYR